MQFSHRRHGAFEKPWPAVLAVLASLGAAFNLGLLYVRNALMVLGNGYRELQYYEAHKTQVVTQFVVSGLVGGTAIALVAYAISRSARRSRREYLP